MLGDFLQYGTAPAANGNTYNWNAASGTYTTGGNRSWASAPTLADGGLIDNGGTATVNSSGANAATAFDLHVRNSSILKVVAGGELLVGNTLGIGGASSSGTLNQSGGLIRLMD